MKFALKVVSLFLQGNKVKGIKVKVKGVINNLKIKIFLKFLNDNSENISRNFSGAVEGNVGSLKFQIVPCSSLYFFSRSMGLFQCFSSVQSLSHVQLFVNP